MAHHQKQYLDRAMSDLGASPLGARHMPLLEDDEAADVDEPPDHHVQFARTTYKSDSGAAPVTSRQSRSHSLLTQGLLVSPDARGSAAFDFAMRRAQSINSNDSAISGFSTAELTSDGGLTSPARTSTPSPPLPSAMGTGLTLLTSKTLDSPTEEHHPPRHPHFTLRSRNTEPVVSIQAPQPQAPRKRCITFACSNPKKDQAKPREEPKPAERQAEKPAEEPKRQSRLKFACPLKPSRDGSDKGLCSPRLRRFSPAPPKMLQRKHRDSVSTVKDEKSAVQHSEACKVSRKTNPEGLRFHEFAASKVQEDAWLSGAPTPRTKLTVTHCLRKENAIRKIGEEAEEEALAEEEEEDDQELEDELEGLSVDVDEEEDDEDDSDSDEDHDDGNETDDEEGFADSDDESDAGSDFQFWTPATATAATSVDHLEHIRPRQHRTVSESSIDSQNEDRGVLIEKPHRGPKHTKAKRSRGSPRMRPGTPELPDSTDFVCGTLDEDQPMEAAYLSCMEQRRVAKLGVIPQDLDPSFPTSDPEQDEDEDDDDEDELDDVSESHALFQARPDDNDNTPHRGRTGAPFRAKSPMPSPPAGKRFNKSPQPGRRAKSPAPQQMTRARGIAIRSPAPRALFGRSPAPRVSPSGLVQSPPSSRRNSLNSDISADLAPHHLAQRPNLTHTKSLPRTPNPFWQEHRRRRLAELRNDEDGSSAAEGADQPARGPIDIVQGLEHKRLRRKDKYWRQHCRQAATKPRRPLPGKGAERMRELGLEVADRTKGYGQRLQLVLSV